MKRYLNWKNLVLCALVLAVTACGSPATEQKPAGPDPGNTLVSDLRVGLDKLNSYHMELVNEFSGEFDGQPNRSTLKSSGDAIREKQIEFVLIQQEATGEENKTILSGNVGDASYSRFGGDSSLCHVVWNTGEKETMNIWPVDMVPALKSGKKVGLETINAIPADHYSLTSDSIGVTDADTMQGDVWLANPGGYIVKLDVTVSGGEKTFGKGFQGTQKVAYELSRINTNNDFALPPGCEPVLTDILVMPDAANLKRMPDNLRYKTGSSNESVIAFYKEKLTATGWRSGEVHTTKSGDQIILFFRTDSPQSLEISITRAENSRLVSVSRLQPSVQEQAPAGDTGPAPALPTLDPARAGLPPEVPIYTGSKDFTGVEGMRLQFTVADPVEKVKEFYKTALKKAGWSALPIPASAAQAPLMFRKGESMLVIQVTEEAGGTTVAITKMK